MKYKSIFTFLLILAMLAVGSSTNALILSYTDTTSKDGFDIEYILNISDGTSYDYDAELTINSNSTSTINWYAGAFNFKLFDGSVPTVLSLSTFSGSFGGWSAADINNNVSIGGWSANAQAGRAGFYLTDLASSLTISNVMDGILVSGTNTASFQFSFSGNGDLNDIFLPFQVGYWADEYAGNSSNIRFGQLSETFSTPVPEPATMLLLGTGLVGLAGIGRKKFLKK